MPHRIASHPSIAMAAPQSKESKLELIRENLSEVLNPEIIDEVLKKDETLRIYWGV